MSKIYFPFNAQLIGGEPDRTANADTFAEYFKGLVGTGVLYDGLQVQHEGGMRVSVLPGKAYIQGKIFSMDAAETLTINNASATLNRIDRVVVRLDEANRMIELAVKQGTAASSPAAPALTRNADVYEICLAQITIPSAAASLSASNIVDKRNDTSVCGWVKNLIRAEIDEVEYRCNGVNDNVELQKYINECVAKYGRVYIKIKGSFGVSTDTFNAIGMGWHFVCTGNHNIVLDFYNCDTIRALGKFVYAQNITIKGLSINSSGSAAVSGTKSIIYGDGAIFEDCNVIGDIKADVGVAYNSVNCTLINCRANISNSAGQTKGINASGAILQGCDITAESTTTSAYGIDGNGAQAHGCKFTAKTLSTSTSSSASGSVCGGFFANCTMIGIGALKGQGLYVRGGVYIHLSGCTLRGYTANATTGWGFGIYGAADDEITVSLWGIVCNSVTLQGYSQTGSLKLTNGSGSVAGAFFMQMEKPDSINSYGSFVKNRT